MELSPLAPSALEVVYLIGSIVAVLFAVYAIRRMSTGQWTVGAGLTLILATFLIPFAGPFLVVALQVRQRWRTRVTA